MRRIKMRCLTLLALATVLTAPLSAQRKGFASPRMLPMRIGSGPSGRGSGQNFAASPNHRSFFYPSVFFADPLYSDSLYSDALYSTGYPLSAQPPIIVMQAPAPDAKPEVSPTPSQPLMIELQGDRYVRVSGEESSTAEMRTIEPQTSAARQSTAVNANSKLADRRPAELAPVELVFRDGHREEVSDYTIADGVLYARGDYYRDGTWNRKIELKSLNMSETIQSNDARGVRLQLPTSPNEVITRP